MEKASIQPERGRVNADDSELQRVWNQTRIPVIVRSDEKGVRLKVRLPFRDDNRKWLQEDRRSDLVWVKAEKLWYLPKSWFDDLVDRAMARWGSVYIIQPYRVTEVCAPACWNAMGHICDCSCMGANHGTGDGTGYFVVSDSFAISYGEKLLACRLLTARRPTCQ